MRYKIAGKSYKLKVLPSEISLKDAIEISKIEINEDTFEEVRNYNLNDAVKTYILSVLEILSDTPKDILLNLEDSELEVLFEMVLPFLEMLYYMDFERMTPIHVKEITFKGKVYELPESLYLDDKEILCHKVSCKVPLEAMNIMQMFFEMKNKGIEVMKYLCAIYWREKGEEGYNEERIANRAKEFEDLPMDIVMSTFFFIYSFIMESMVNTLNSLVKTSLPRRAVTKVKDLLAIGYILLLKLVWPARLEKLKNSQFGISVKS